MLKNEKGFTLIELLAVIIILGVLMLIAIPSVTSYINNSRKAAYVDTAKRIVDGAVILVNSGGLDVYDTNTTYYIPGQCINTETGGEASPYGEWKDRYVVVTYTGDGYDYYWASADVTKMGINLTYRDNLKINDVKAGIGSVETNIHIGDREKIVVFSDCASGTEVDMPGPRIGDREDYTGIVNTPATSTTTNDNVTWENGIVKLTVVSTNCWNNGRTCQPQITVTNKGETDTLVGFKATFTIPNGVRVTSGPYDSQDFRVFISGNTLTIIGNPNTLVDRLIAPKNSKSTGLQIALDNGASLSLSDGDITYTVLQPGNKTFNLSNIKVELLRKNMWDKDGKIRMIYDVAVTNKKSSTLDGWSFKINSTGISGVTVHSPLKKNSSSSTQIDLSAVTGSGTGYTLSSGQRVFYDSKLEFELDDINAEITVTE